MLYACGTGNELHGLLWFMGSTTGQATLDLLRSMWVPAGLYVYEPVHSAYLVSNEAKRRHENWTYRQCTGNPFWVLCRSSLCPCLCGRASAPGPCLCLLVFPPAASPFCFLTFPPISQTLDIFLKLTFSFCHVISWLTGSPSFGDLTLSGKF